MNKEKWKILIVDDEKNIRKNILINLLELEHSEKKVDFLEAGSSVEARKVLEENPDIAVIILDVMMEEDRAGLNFSKWIRDDLKNEDVNILIYTGEPGLAPKTHVADHYKVDGYIDKNSSNNEDIYATVKTALRIYEKNIQSKKKPQRDGVQIVCEMIEIYISMLHEDFVYEKDNLINHNADLMKLENEIQSFFRVQDAKEKLKEGTTELKLLGEGFNYENIIISHNRNYQISFMSNDEIILNKNNFIKEFKKRLTQFLNFKHIPKNLEQKIKEKIK